jgi:hypothetical protein
MHFERQLYPRDIGMSPQFAMNRFKAAVEKCGREKLLSEHRFQKARQTRATAAFLTGLSKMTQKTYWLALEYVNPTPDTYGMPFAPHPEYERGKIREMPDVEVSEFEDHARNSPGQSWRADPS